MADRSLSFNVAAIDRASKSFEKIALRIERLENKLERLDHKHVDVDVDVDTHKADRKIRRFTKRVGDAFGAIPSRLKGVLIAGLFAAIIAAAPVAGAIAASALVLAFGAGLSVIGIIAAAQSKEVRKAFSDLADHVKKVAKRISEPFEPALKHVAKVAGDVFDSFAPTLKKAFKDIAPAMSLFADDLGQAFKALKPAIKPISDAFVDILGAIGPKLPGLFKAIGDAMAGLSKVVSNNKEIFATVFVGLLHAIPLAIRFIGFLAKSFARVTRGAIQMAPAVVSAFIEVAKGVQFVVDAVLSFIGLMVHGLAKAFGWIPGLGPKLKTAAGKFDDFKSGVDDTFDKLISKALGFKTTLEKLPKVIKIKGRIDDLRQKIRKAKNKLKDPDLTKPEKTKIRATIKDLREKIKRAKARLRQPNLRLPKKTRIRGNIDDLKQKIHNAKHRLKNKNLTRPEKSKIRADIRDLRRKVRAAKARLRTLKDKTVTVHVATVYTSSGNRYSQHTSIGGTTQGSGRFASGGLLRGAGTATSDSMLIRGSTGEYMVRAAAVKRVGTAFLDAVNQGKGTPSGGRYAGGGLVTGKGSGDVYVTVELDGAPISARIRAEQAEEDRTKRRRVLAGSGRRAA